MTNIEWIENTQTYEVFTKVDNIEISNDLEGHIRELIIEEVCDYYDYYDIVEVFVNVDDNDVYVSVHMEDIDLDSGEVISDIVEDIVDQYDGRKGE